MRVEGPSTSSLLQFMLATAMTFFDRRFSELFSQAGPFVEHAAEDSIASIYLY